MTCGKPVALVAILMHRSRSMDWPPAPRQSWYGNPFNTSIAPTGGVAIIGYDDAINHADTPTEDYLKSGILRGDGLAVVGVDTLKDYKTTAATAPAGNFVVSSGLLANQLVVARDCQNHLTYIGQTTAANSAPATGASATFNAGSGVSAGCQLLSPQNQQPQRASAVPPTPRCRHGLCRALHHMQTTGFAQ